MSSPLTLALDASTYTGSVALIEGSQLLSECEVAMRGEKEERLMPAVESVISNAGVRPADIGRIACGGGPGSFTSPRIAAAIGKGMAAGRGIPLYTASSLILIVTGSPAGATPGRYLAVLDALRGDVYTAAYEVRESASGDDGKLEVLEIAPLALVERENAAALAKSLGARCIGPPEELSAIPRASGFARIGAVVACSGRGERGLRAGDDGPLAAGRVRWGREYGRRLRS